jgi:hypothetical protein
MVNKHGSIFHPVHQENDVGIDGFIELVHSEQVSGQLIAIQVKSGDSYLDAEANRFVVPTDEQHVRYWESVLVPVVLVCYSPTMDKAAWVSVRDYIAYEKYHGRLPVKKFEVEIDRLFDCDALSDGIARLAAVRSSERDLLRCADMCLSDDPDVRNAGFSVLSRHPDSKNLKIVCHLARRLIMDSNVGTAKGALFILGYDVGRARWSWTWGNPEEGEIMSYASEVCGDLTPTEIRRLVELCDDEYFSGPTGLGERCLDVIGCCLDTAFDVLQDIASDRNQPMRRRANAIYLLHSCDDDEMDELLPELLKDDAHKDVAQWMLHGSQPEKPQ